MKCTCKDGCDCDVTREIELEFEDDNGCDIEGEISYELELEDDCEN